MASDKASVRRLVAMCADLGLKNVILSPGSRNAPMSISFCADDRFDVKVIPDERSAAFFAMGMGLYQKIPSILVCTSGTAALNYAPAIAEAYYQKIPLLILTADRPVKHIDQGMGQTIRQKNVYLNYVKASFEITTDLNAENELYHNDLIISEAIWRTRHKDFGPVHVNIPLEEPLYNTENVSDDIPLRHFIPSNRTKRALPVKHLKNTWNTAARKMIICGQSIESSAMEQILRKLASRSDLVLLTEMTSNLSTKPSIDHIDQVLASIPPNNKKPFFRTC